MIVLELSTSICSKDAPCAITIAMTGIPMAPGFHKWPHCCDIMATCEKGCWAPVTYCLSVPVYLFLRTTKLVRRPSNMQISVANCVISTRVHLCCITQLAMELHIYKGLLASFVVLRKRYTEAVLMFMIRCLKCCSCAYSYLGGIGFCIISPIRNVGMMEISNSLELEASKENYSFRQGALCRTLGFAEASKLKARTINLQRVNQMDADMGPSCVASRSINDFQNHVNFSKRNFVQHADTSIVGKEVNAKSRAQKRWARGCFYSG
ncbi:uncharacterized protein MELLADRAFT_94883 [Melampsora larici-populina 98AG31]|uniref:Uncharacterized protein n=1 Tax=Melampsora larici-populina (strain 98AG31 / pathotype 3-4-7) TaxID=747676 RepID=F4S895_MELLP|nr:uncharacterized protein MELLADRAFT_94883 [Melampsora larici-populina 98AG31]EGF99145.1 hypothetical protein MELLADRAFT_94883 [Melampsora larici-populina 98AG31]